METFKDIVLSTRIRFARNVKNYKFSNNMIDKEQEDLLMFIKNKLENKYKILELANMDEITKKSLVETHMVSKELLNKKNTAIIVDKLNDITTMINEEDHFRIQAFSKEFNLDSTYSRIKEFDNDISKKIEYSIDKLYGYITACPTCIGTGMRVSVMLHLPGLGKIGVLDRILNEISKLGISIRGRYGEGTSSEGYIYQISNQKTLGIKEEDIINQIKQVTSYIVEQERKARHILKDNIEIIDEIYRSYGILQNARIIDKNEALELLSLVRMGVYMSIISHIDSNRIEELIKNIEENTLRKNLKEDFSRNEENIKRANYIRKEMI